MKRMFCLAAVSAILCANPANAEAPQGQGSAALYIQKTNSTPMRWSGVGELRAQNDLCVISDTGRFRLRVQIAGIQQGAAIPDFEVTFTTTAGDRVTRRSGESDVLVFDGRATPVANCNGVINANLQFRFPERGLSAAIAGNYLQQFILSVEPV